MEIISKLIHFGCVEQIFVMRQLAEKVIEKDNRMHAGFVDLEKAYDKVCRQELWEALQKCLEVY